MRLLLDAMWPAEIAEQLRRSGYDVVAAIERPNLARTGDPVILRVAAIEQRVVVTEDAGDFRRLAEVAFAHGDGHCGFVFTTNRTFPRANPRTLGRLVRALEVLLDSDLDLTNTEHWLRPVD